MSEMRNGTSSHSLNRLGNEELLVGRELLRLPLLIRWIKAIIGGGGAESGCFSLYFPQIWLAADDEYWV